jgi:hypothetical protein
MTWGATHKITFDKALFALRHWPVKMYRVTPAPRRKYIDYSVGKKVQITDGCAQVTVTIKAITTDLTTGREVYHVE